ncbi:MAG: hypothetical protein ABSA41_17965 [Terriglobia bacterium]|jgi:hypothetical protein
MVVIRGAGATVTVDDFDLLVSATEVAVTVTVEVFETDVGAVYVAVAVVTLVKVPQVLPKHPGPEALQVTPRLPESLATAALKLTVWP